MKCCRSCKHNLVPPPRRFGRIVYRIKRWLYPLIGWCWSNEEEQPLGRCELRPTLYCYDQLGSPGCERSREHTLPQFLACRSCGDYEQRRTK